MSELILSQQIQVGVDVATSLTIIGAMLSWFFESRRRSKKERELEERRFEEQKKLSFDENSKSVSLGKVQDILSEIENIFRVVVESAQSFENIVDRFSKGESVEEKVSELSNTISSKEDYLPRVLERASEFIKSYGEYYELIQIRRYSLVPSIIFHNEGEEFKDSLLKDMDDVGEQFNEFSGFLQVAKTESEEYRRAIDSNEEERVEEILRELSLSLLKLSQIAQRARMEAKDIPIKIASIVYVMLQGGDININAATEMLAGDSYFSREKTIR